MAYRKRFGRAKAWYGRRSNRTKSVLGVGMPFLAGVILGLTDIDKSVPAELKLGVACVPGNILKGLGPIRSVAQGMVIGDLIQARTGFSLGGSGSSATSGSW